MVDMEAKESGMREKLGNLEAFVNASHPKDVLASVLRHFQELFAVSQGLRSPTISADVEFARYQTSRVSYLR